MQEINSKVYSDAMERIRQFLNPMGTKHFQVNDEISNKITYVALEQAKMSTSKQSPIYQLLLSMVKRANNKQPLAEISQRDLYNAIYVVLKPMLDFSQVNKRQQEDLANWTLNILFYITPPTNKEMMEHTASFPHFKSVEEETVTMNALFD